MKLCSAEDCDSPVHARGLCPKHYYRLRVNGDASKTQKMGPKPRNDLTYPGAHQRVYAAKGRASDNSCKCGEPAEDWAYDGQDPQELTDPQGRSYSLDPEHYEPLCRTCHKNEDLARRKVAS